MTRAPRATLAAVLLTLAALAAALLDGDIRRVPSVVLALLAFAQG